MNTDKEGGKTLSTISVQFKTGLQRNTEIVTEFAEAQ